ncbi:MAG: succinate dehydrogenase/fumarate reductase iron-sulfur subunit [Nitrososphaerota archaeon]|jgi:succinate dehydrogenase / fumarate reductase iron-sulfur subunit|nr:succinate dehydrogenase/fumarate reductase iron-sulfur subunit [Nitrososphaerota archaeon]MDG6920688.1 succinate dehydrogenase/fumarate reductase iron-sulfur subunit [Nitrososphaerota archaeon]MDG6947395.1 succinate dehydrogenase/fumarate reductase iron-sulfur subunit [Nitrososphaerota archaeon]
MTETLGVTGGGPKEKRVVRLRIQRGGSRGTAPPHYDTFEVPREDGMVVLNAVHYIQSHLDPSLAVRWNCKAGRCGSCSAEINGRPQLMCKTRVDSIDGDITIEPMQAFPHLRDLVTDVTANWKVAAMIPPFTPKADAGDTFTFYQADVDRSREFRRCIECFLCMDVCHVVREHEADYIGPRWVVKAASLDMHPMDGLNRSKFMKDAGGLGFCNITKCCQEICPEHIVITDDAIIPEKERVVDRHYDPILWVYRHLRGEAKADETK